MEGQQRIDDGYLGSGIGALEECTRVCLPERQPLVHMIIGQAYKLLRMPFKTFEEWKFAIELHKDTKSLAPKRVRLITVFLDEIEFFSRLVAEAQKAV